jgi:SAM-dependent methyltransferase
MAVVLDVPIVFLVGWVGGGYPTVGAERASSYAAAHAMSHPFEAMSSLLAVVQSGVLQRHPKLRLGFFEAGCGWAPWWLSRIAEHAALKPQEFPHGVPTPDRIWLSLDASEPLTGGLTRSEWKTSLCFASDFPHADGTFPGAVRNLRAKRLHSAVERAVLGDNALRLFGASLAARLGGSERTRQAANSELCSFLEARGAATTRHSGRALLSHLQGTCSLLRGWGTPEALCRAGLFHSVYGSEAFESAIVSGAERPLVRRLIGDEAEQLAWLFGRCRQQALVDTADTAPRVVDYELGTEIAVSEQQRRDLCELCVANWLEQRPRLDHARQQQLLAASKRLAPWLSAAARSALTLASEVEEDDRALRRWVSNSHRVVTMTLGGAPRKEPTFEPNGVLRDAASLQVLTEIASVLRHLRWDNAADEHPATRLALREPVATQELLDWLGRSRIDALTAVGALTPGDRDTATLAVGMVRLGEEVVIVPGDGRRQDGVYFGIEPLLLEMARRAIAPDAGEVLEMGAGAGLASVLAARRATSTATDVLSRATQHVELTRALNPHLEPRLRAVTTDGALGLAAASFDLVLANPPLVPRLEGISQPTYSFGGPTGSELPIRLLGEALSLLRPDGCVAMLSLDSQLRDGRRPLLEALAHLDDGWSWMKLVSPWRFLVPNSVPRLLATHRDTLAHADHVGVFVIRQGDGGAPASRERLRQAAAALCGSGWSVAS